MLKCASCKESTGGIKKKDAEFDFDVSEVEAYFDQIFQAQVETIGDNSIERERTHKVLRKRGTVHDDDLVKAPLISESIFVSGNESNKASQAKKKGSSHQNYSPDYGSIIEFVEAALENSVDCESSDDDSSTCDSCSSGGDGRKLTTISQVAATYKLDKDLKQLATYEIICATFLLGLVQETGDAFRSTFSEAVGADPSCKQKLVIEKLRRMAAKSDQVTSGSSNPDQLLMF